MFGLFKKAQNKLKNTVKQVQNNKQNLHNNQTPDQILQQYSKSRFTPLDIDLDKLKLDAKPVQKNNDILTGRAKSTKIPIYTGNPFNPYF